MDRLKFRVWAEQNGEGKHYHAESGCPFLMNLNGDVINAPADRNPRVNDTCFARVAYNDVTVEQGTGLRDSEGTLIYEGDVVEVYNPELDEVIAKGEVKWCKHYTGFYIKPKCDDPTRRISCGYHGRHKVIGNIHENAELLEGE